MWTPPRRAGAIDPRVRRVDHRPRNPAALPAKQPSPITKAALIGLMTLGSLSMWIANPALWLWITAHLQQGTQPQMGPYALMLLGILLTCVLLGKAISIVHRYYERITGRTPTVHMIMPWRRSLRGGRSQKRETDGRRPVNTLDVIMVISVLLAVATFTTWFIEVKPAPPGLSGDPAKH